MKIHVGTDTRGQVHSLTTTDTTTADTTQLDDLLHGRESTLDGDKGPGKRLMGSSGNRAAARTASIGAGSAHRDGTRSTGPGPASGPVRARVPCREAPVRLRQGALSRPCEKHDAHADHLRACQPLSGAPHTGRWARSVGARGRTPPRGARWAVTHDITIVFVGLSRKVATVRARNADCHDLFRASLIHLNGRAPTPSLSSRTIRSSPVSSQYTSDTGIMPTAFTSLRKRFIVN